MKALDGLRAGKTPRQIAVDIYGADEVAAEWYSEPVLAGRAADEPVDRQLFHDVGAVRRPVREQPGNHGQGVVARIGCQVLTQAFATTTDMLNAA